MLTLYQGPESVPGRLISSKENVQGWGAGRLLVKWQEPLAHRPVIGKAKPSVSAVFLIILAFLNKPSLPPILSHLPLVLPPDFYAVTCQWRCALLPQLTAQCWSVKGVVIPPAWLEGRETLLPPVSLTNLLNQTHKGSGTKTHTFLFQTSSSVSLFCSPLFTEYIKSSMYQEIVKDLLALVTWFSKCVNYALLTCSELSLLMSFYWTGEKLLVVLT